MAATDGQPSAAFATIAFPASTGADQFGWNQSDNQSDGNSK
jgi:hypothetical protein